MSGSWLSTLKASISSSTFFLLISPLFREEKNWFWFWSLGSNLVNFWSFGWKLAVLVCEWSEIVLSLFVEQVSCLSYFTLLTMFRSVFKEFWNNEGEFSEFFCWVVANFVFAADLAVELNMAVFVFLFVFACVIEFLNVVKFQSLPVARPVTCPNLPANFSFDISGLLEVEFNLKSSFKLFGGISIIDLLFYCPNLIW